MSSVGARQTVRAVGPPLFLIGLGALFLADYRLGWSWTTTWPALLVLAGLLQTFAQLARRKSGSAE